MGFDHDQVTLEEQAYAYFIDVLAQSLVLSGGKEAVAILQPHFGGCLERY